MTKPTLWKSTQQIKSISEAYRHVSCNTKWLDTKIWSLFVHPINSRLSGIQYRTVRYSWVAFYSTKFPFFELVLHPLCCRSLTSCTLKFSTHKQAQTQVDHDKCKICIVKRKGDKDLFHQSSGSYLNPISLLRRPWEITRDQALAGLESNTFLDTLCWSFPIKGMIKDLTNMPVAFHKTRRSPSNS